MVCLIRQGLRTHILGPHIMVLLTDYRLCVPYKAGSEDPHTGPTYHGPGNRLHTWCAYIRHCLRTHILGPHIMVLLTDYRLCVPYKAGSEDPHTRPTYHGPVNRLHTWYAYVRQGLRTHILGPHITVLVTDYILHVLISCRVWGPIYQGSANILHI